MDLRFPDLPAPRDPAPDSASRRNDRADTGFSDLLSVNMTDREETREAPANKPRADEPKRTDNAKRADDAKSDIARAPAKTRRDDDRRGDDDVREPADQAMVQAVVQPPPQTPEAPAQNLPAQDTPPVDAVEPGTVAAQAQQPTLAAAGATGFTVPVPSAAPVAPQPAEAVPATAPAPAIGAANAPTTAPGKDVADAAPKPASADTTLANTPPESIASDAAMAPPEPPKTPSVAPASGSDTADKTKAQDQTPASPAVPASSSANVAPPRADQMPAAPQPAAPAPAQAAASQAAAATEVRESNPDDAQIVAVVRAAPSATRPSTAQSTAPRASAAPAAPQADRAVPESAPDAKSAASDHGKSDAPQRPTGTLSPSTGVAAQMTAQQAPANTAAQGQASAPQDLGVADPEPAKPAKDGGDGPKSADAQGSARMDGLPPPDAGTRNVTVDAATAASRAARPALHPIIAQVAAHLTQAAADASDRISIRLSPADLGRIDVRLDFGPDGRVQAVFAADKAQTVGLLQRDARDLERALQDAGLRADSGSLSFNLRGDQRDGFPSYAAPTGKNARDDIVVEPTVPLPQPYVAGKAAAGRVDIRV